MSTVIERYSGLPAVVRGFITLVRPATRCAAAYSMMGASNRAVTGALINFRRRQAEIVNAANPPASDRTKPILGMNRDTRSLSWSHLSELRDG